MAMPIFRLVRNVLFLGVVWWTSADSLFALDISVQELREKTERGDAFLLIDVREPYEHAEFNLGGELIPLGKLGGAEAVLAIRSKLKTYPTDEMVVYDRTGSRSATAQSLLTQQGFENVRNLTGGVFAWIEAFGSVSPQLQPAAPPPPPQPELTSDTEGTTANDPVAERPNDEATFEVDPSADDSGGDDALDEDGLGGEENVPAAFDAEEREEAVAPEGDPGDEDWGGDEDVSADDA
jgi:rhodanese-related sulfurtransferase